MKEELIAKLNELSLEAIDQLPIVAQQYIGMLTVEILCDILFFSTLLLALVYGTLKVKNLDYFKHDKESIGGLLFVSGRTDEICCKKIQFQLPQFR